MSVRPAPGSAAGRPDDLGVDRGDLDARGPRWRTTRLVDADPDAPLTPRPPTEDERRFLRVAARRWDKPFLLVVGLVAAAVALLVPMVGYQGASAFGAPPGRPAPDAETTVLLFYGLFLVPLAVAPLWPAVRWGLMLARGRLAPFARPAGRGLPLRQVTGAYTEHDEAYTYEARLYNLDDVSAGGYEAYAATALAMPPHWRRYLLPGAYAVALGETHGREAPRRGLSGALRGTGQQFYAVAVAQAFSLVRLARETDVGVPGRLLHGADEPEALALSVDREVGRGLLDLVWYRPVRAAACALAYACAVVVVGLTGAGLVGGAVADLGVLGGLGAVRAFLGAAGGRLVLTVLAVTGPAAVFAGWRHRRALRRIRAGYAQSGLAEWPRALRREWARSPAPGAGSRR